MDTKTEGTKRKQLRGIPSVVPSKHHLNKLIIDTRHLLSGVIQVRDQMPRSQKDPSGLGTLITQQSNRALYLAVLISNYASRQNREALLRELDTTLKHLKELIITALERGYITKRNTADNLAMKILAVSNDVISYAKGLEDKKKRS